MYVCMYVCPHGGKCVCVCVSPSLTLLDLQQMDTVHASRLADNLHTDSFVCVFVCVCKRLQ